MSLLPILAQDQSNRTPPPNPLLTPASFVAYCLFQLYGFLLVNDYHGRPNPSFYASEPTATKFTKNNTANMPFTASDICKILLAIILPPIGVFLERGCGADFLINILLTCLGYIPGIIHALYIIFKF
jgi:uncharacterized membrane protein YqaE (UPF0057 family)